jgi:hypothetical protein
MGAPGGAGCSRLETLPSPDPEIRRALAQLAAIDEQLAATADRALNSLTWDEPLTTVTQHGLQSFLWYEMPRKWPVEADEQLDAARALGRLLEMVGFPRYAAICASALTEEILTLWDQDPAAGFAAFRRAMERSGVEPPDVPELVWGQVMGMIEAGAYHHTARALEVAIAAGDLRPGARGWRTHQARIARRYLTEPPEDGPERLSPLDAVLSERLETWAGRGGDERARILRPVAKELAAPVPVPDDAAAALEPLSWLLRRGAEGIALTQTGNINRALAREAAERFGWWGYHLPPTGENDLPVLSELRDVAREIGALRRSRARLVVTQRGSALAEDPAALWRATAATMLAGDDFATAAGELALALLVVEGSLPESRLAPVIGPVLSGGGWRDPAGQPPDQEAVRWAIHRSLGRPELLAMLRRAGPWQDPVFSLDGLGRATALEALRARATGPRRSPFV